MNLLIIPAWYPTEKQPLNGSFVREQALLMQDDYRIKVLYPVVIGLRKVDFLKRKLTKGFAPLFEEYKPLTPPDAEPVFHISYQRSEKLLFENTVNQLDRRLSALINSGWKPDVIHAHVTKWAGAYAVVLGRKYKIPVIITEHTGPFLLDNFSPYNKQLIIDSLEKADLVLSVSNHQSRALLSHGIKIKPQIVGPVVDDAAFRITDKTRTTNEFVITTVTGSQFFKDLDTFIASLAILKKKGFRKFKAQIISIEPLGEEYIKLISENNLSDVCELHSAVAREQMPEFYANSDVVVSTSIAETFGVSIGEAIACGKPVISTRNGGSEDFINESNGFLINIQDHQALAEKLIYLIEIDFHKSPQQIRETIVSTYGREVFKKRMNGIYRETVERFKR